MQKFKLLFALLLPLAGLASSAAASGNQTSIDVSTPRPNTAVDSPLLTQATASTTCPRGITSMAIYSGGKLVGSVSRGASINTTLTLNPGPQNLTVAAWDNCGGSASTSVPINVVSQGLDIFSKQSSPTAPAASAAASATTAATSCGPPNYCSRSDTAVVQFPSPLPNFGSLAGVNTVVTDPTFHNPVLRFTDANTDPTFPNRNFCTGLGGSGDKTVWNADSTLLLVCETGGRYFPVRFDPVNFRQLGPLYGSHPVFVSGPGVFSRTNPNYFYKFTKGQVALLDYTNRTTPPSPKLIYDFTNCGITSPITWQAIAGVDVTDNVFGVAYSTTGGQDTGKYVATYNRTTRVCTQLNTVTGVVTSWPGGKVLGVVASTPDRFLIHNVVMKGNSWLVVVRGHFLSGAYNPTASAYGWQIGTPVLNQLLPKAGGHFATGCGLWINAAGWVGEYFEGRHYSNPGSVTPLWTVPSTCGGANQPSCRMPFDVHPATYGGCADNTPVCSSTVVKNTSNNITAPYQDEIVCFSTDGSNKHWRFAHTYSSVASNDFNGAYSIGGLSQDGKFYAWTTVNGGAFGCANGTMNCTLPNRRTDVLIVKLQ